MAKQTTGKALSQPKSAANNVTNGPLFMAFRDKIRHRDSATVYKLEPGGDRPADKAAGTDVVNNSA